MIENILNNNIANNIKNYINNILINDTIEITSFHANEVTNNVYELRFGVVSPGLTQITDIKVRDVNDIVLIHDIVEINITGDGVVIKFLITVN